MTVKEAEILQRLKSLQHEIEQGNGLDNEIVLQQSIELENILKDKIATDNIPLSTPSSSSIIPKQIVNLSENPRPASVNPAPPSKSPRNGNSVSFVETTTTNASSSLATFDNVNEDIDLKPEVKKELERRGAENPLDLFTLKDEKKKSKFHHHHHHDKKKLKNEQISSDDEESDDDMKEEMLSARKKKQLQTPRTPKIQASSEMQQTQPPNQSSISSPLSSPRQKFDLEQLIITRNIDQICDSLQENIYENFKILDLNKQKITNSFEIFSFFHLFF